MKRIGLSSGEWQAKKEGGVRTVYSRFETNKKAAAAHRHSVVERKTNCAEVL